MSNPIAGYASLVRLVAYGAVAAVVAGSYVATYYHGKKVQRGEDAEASAEALEAHIKAISKEIKAREQKADQTAQAIASIDARIDSFGRQLRRTPGGCVPTPERLRVLQDATAAANATGFAGPVPAPP